MGLTQLVQAHGISMMPYLQGQDFLVVELCPVERRLRVGDLVLIDAPGASRDIAPKGRIIHRMIGQNLTKGDQNKKSDQEIWGEVEIQGRVIGRMIGRGNRWVSYAHPLCRGGHRLQGWVSRVNQWRFRKIHRLAYGVLFVLGKFMRFLEERLGAETYG